VAVAACESCIQSCAYDEASNILPGARMPMTRNPLRSRRRLALLVLAAALAASIALGVVFVAQKRAAADQRSWPPTPQPMRIDESRDARIAEVQLHAPVAPSQREVVELH
jgi:hypothetical protein